MRPDLADALQVLLGLGKDGPLAPGTQYFYVVGDSVDAQSKALSFTTPPLTGPESLPYRRASESPTLGVKVT